MNITPPHNTSIGPQHPVSYYNNIIYSHIHSNNIHARGIAMSRKKSLMLNISM